MGLDPRPHDIMLLKIKHISLKEKYGECEIPYEAKMYQNKIWFWNSPYIYSFPDKLTFLSLLLCGCVNQLIVVKSQHSYLFLILEFSFLNLLIQEKKAAKGIFLAMYYYN